MKKKRGIILSFILISIILISLSSAKFSDILNKLTGRAGEQQQGISINVRGARPAQINYVSTIGSVSPLQASYREVEFEVHMYDPDRARDLNRDSVNASFIYGLEQRTTGDAGSCAYVGDLDDYTANFSCVIRMWYWDSAANNWQVIVQGRDKGNRTWQFNDTTTFTYNELKSMDILPISLTWPEVVPGALNQISDNDPVVINNSGNYNGAIFVRAMDLIGQDNPSETISANNFTVFPTSGQECSSSATSMINGSYVSISSSSANKGNLSMGGGIGQEELYYCIPEVPIVSSQAYNTAYTGGNWVIAYVS